MDTPRDPRLRWLELAGVVLLLAAAVVPRARDLYAPFDRAIDGFQGSCFALFAINYERVGVGTYGGYPVFNVDLPSDPDTLPYVYANHPPLVPLLGWASLHLTAPEDWNQAWKRDEAPEGIEGALRLPFFLLHLVGLWALWWALRQADGLQRAMLGLAVAAVLPIGILCAGLVNYENACVPPLLVALGFHVRWLRSNRRADLWWSGAFAFLASCVTFTPVFFAPAVVLHTLYHDLRLRRASVLRRPLLEALVFGAATLLPLAAHGFWVRLHVPAAASSVWTRAASLLGPLFDGSQPFSEWARRQVLRLTYFCTPWLFAIAVAGLVVALARALRPPADATDARDEGAARVPTVSVVLPLALGAGLSQLAFYTHTFDGDAGHNGQTNFLLNLAPAVAALAAVAFDAVARPLWKLRGGFAPLVLLVATCGLPALGRAGAIRREWREPGPRDVSATELEGAVEPGRLLPLPKTAGAQIHDVLPARTVGLFPMGSILGPAVSYYAWRTLLGVNRENWGMRLATIDDVLGLPEVERTLLFPRDPLPGATGAVQTFRPGLLERFGEPLHANEHWEVWPPEP